MKVAVVGAGISGLDCPYELAKSGVQVLVYEKEDYIGGHAKIVTVDGVDLEFGFMVFNRVNYSNMIEFFECLGVDMEVSDMSFSVSLDQGRGCEWGTRNGFASLFVQKKNVLNPYFWQMIREISRFKQDVISYLEELDNNPDIDRKETLGEFIESHGYSELFQKAYLIAICASIWTWAVLLITFSYSFTTTIFCRVLLFLCLQLFGLPQLLTVRWRSHINKVKEELEKRGCQIRTGCEVNSVTTTEEDKRYDSHRQSTDFMREYIFPGGCVPSLSQVTSAMSAASRLCAPGRDRNSLLPDTEMLAKKLPEKTKAKFVLWDSIISSSGHGSTTLTTVLLDSKRAQQEIIRSGEKSLKIFSRANSLYR